MAAQQHASSNGGTSIVKPAEQPSQPLNARAEASVVESPQLSMTERKRRLAEILVAKTEQGYRIESQTDTDATLMMKGRRRRRWFGMGGSNTETRQITSIDEQGRARTRGL
jgi:hypothetical protein